MSRKYKFYNKEGLYFVSFATAYWMDVFIRDYYTWQLVDNRIIGNTAAQSIIVDGRICWR